VSFLHLLSDRRLELLSSLLSRFRGDWARDLRVEITWILLGRARLERRGYGFD